ncbi:MAG: methyltransferase domain-containing protein [Alphaproteobacteria bacterium]|nr:methyltransferase domain-containing protein [Alphaproteobacteria bacterium]
MSYTLDPELIPGILNRFWYYSMEIAPGIITPGGTFILNYATPRQVLSKIDVQGLRCLDIGTMEGLVPILWAKRGASQVVAVDARAGCIEKIDLLKKIYDVSFDYLLLPSSANAYDYLRQVEFASEFYKSPFIEGYKEFDLVNLSGVLYHVWSPLHWIASCRPLVREGGLMVLSTHLLDTDEPVMEFNTKGKLQMQADTFWFISPSVFQYMLNFFGLKPIGSVGIRVTSAKKPSVYMSVVCRAVDAPIMQTDDEWAKFFIKNSMERENYYREKSYRKPGFVKYNGKEIDQTEPEISLLDVVKNAPDQVAPEFRKFNYTLRLNDME